ncbi:MAG TPA: class I SAM-dependent methyltransferase, partial [Thermodesulfovibrionales bacterium]|nr:class I SAM-dependent methyltransferase [Thermodesulfovibrionales bacterium]
MKFMDDLAKEYTISFFDKSLRMFGDRPEAVRWTAEGQLARYKALLDIADSIEGSSILDFGCGKGDFLRFLKDRNIQVRYTGFDINEKLISVASAKYPSSAFRVFDLGKTPLNEDFDYIFLCGVFNLKVQKIDRLIRSTLRELFGHCRIGLAFSALSAL